jgi:hypothetical protein
MHTASAQGSQTTIWHGFWHRLELHPVKSLVVLYVLSVVLYCASIPLPRIDGQLTGSDGAFYYSYLPALLLHHGLDFTDQYAALAPKSAVARSPLTAAGGLTNKYTVGTPILWVPFFLIGHCLAFALRLFGHSIRLDGLGYVYQIPTLLGSMTYGFAGVLLVYRSCRRFFGRAACSSAAILIWFATNLVYYMIAEPSMSHACSFFAGALFLNLWLSYRPHPSPKQWMILGISGGLIGLVRPADAAWLVLPVVDSILTLKTDWRNYLAGFCKGIVLFCCTAAATFSPQMGLSYYFYGNPFRSGYLLSNSPFHWLSPKVFSVLFSLRHGLFSWHPVLIFALIGVVLFYRKERSLVISLALVAAAQTYVVSSWSGWSAGDSFGSRMLISLLPILALGFSALIEWAAARRAYAAIFLPAACFVVWNALFIVQYRMGFISKKQSIIFYQLTVGKAAMLKEIPERLRLMLR